MVKLLDIKNTEPDVDLAFRKVSIIIDTQLILIELMSKTKPENEEIPSYNLPQSDNKWIYEQWAQSNDGRRIVYQAVRTPNTDFFMGNVFQIVVKDNKGEPLGSGSGFVINDQGWFITNNHVMEDGYSATAFFDIKDSENGQW